MRNVIAVATLFAPTVWAFTPISPQHASKTASSLKQALTGDERRASWDSVSPISEISCSGGGDWCSGSTGDDRRASWDSYSPISEIGCSGGGDWCSGSEDNSASTLESVAAAAIVASTLSGLGGGASVKKSYALGSWNPSAGSPTTGSAAGGSATKLRRPIVAGNWKLNPATKGEAVTLLKLLAANFVNHRDSMSQTGAPEAVIFPPLPYIADAVQILEGSGIQVGAQNVGANEKGAFTGEIAPSMIASAGCSYVLLGHSERRTLFGETDEHINTVLHKCLLQASLKIILCIGETLQEYEAGLLEQVVDTQIRKGLAGVDANVLLNDRVIIAYEPVWAIGTGLVATPDQAQAAHVAIRNSLSTFYGSEDVASGVRIQYGGSVTPESISNLMGEMDVDGALVGGASLDADSFTRIFDGAQS